MNAASLVEVRAEDRRATHVALLGWATLAQYRPQKEWEERHGSIVLHASATPNPDFNYVLVLGDEPPERVRTEAARFFGTRTRYSVIVDMEAAPRMDGALQGHPGQPRHPGGNWTLDEEEPAMVIAPLPAAEATPPAPPELSIRRVDGEEAFEEFFRVSGGGKLYIPSLAAATDPDVALLLGAVEGTVVATSRLACATSGDAPHLKVAEINGVVTLPAYRRRGYGTAMTWAAVKEGANRGATAAVLHASELGAPVYRRMGFRHAGTYRTYVPADE